MARALGLLAVTSVYAFTHDESAACYASRYPDLRAVFCATGRCDTRALHDHYKNSGATERRLWGCHGAHNPFGAPRATHVRPAAAPGNPVAYRTHAERVALRRHEWKLGRARKRAAGEQARAANATCYAKNYADLDYHFCKKGCNVGALLDHFRDRGRAARRSI